VLTVIFYMKQLSRTKVVLTLRVPRWSILHMTLTKLVAACCSARTGSQNLQKHP